MKKNQQCIWRGNTKIRLVNMQIQIGHPKEGSFLRRFLDFFSTTTWEKEL